MLNDFALNVTVIEIILLIQFFSGVYSLNLRYLSHKKYKMTGYLGRGLLDTCLTMKGYLAPSGSPCMLGY